MQKKRSQLIDDGYCIVENILSEDFLVELRRESDRQIEAVTTPPPHWKYQGSDIHVKGLDNPLIDRLLRWPATNAALAAMGLDDFPEPSTIIILSKPPRGGPLYWHQDWTNWNDPISAAPWPQYLFMAYYLTDTTRHNGCLRVIPGTHRKRIDLHDRLTPAHKEGAYAGVDDNPDMVADDPRAVDVNVKASDLVIGEGRILHAAHGNQSDARRTLMISFRARPRTVPANWTGDVPEAIRNRDPDAKYAGTRIPGKYLA